MTIHKANSREELLQCFEVMKALRPHHNAESFCDAIEQMQNEGYQLLYLADEGKPVCVAGYRITITLYDGAIIDFDDFVTLPDSRSKGYAGHLFDHLVAMAKERSIKTIHLNSSHQRFDAHRFYLKKKMKIVAHHFRMEV